MININDTTVAVETSAELKSVLEGNNNITLIYLAKDITLAQEISILATKTEVTVDGLYPTDGTGVIHTYTDIKKVKILKYSINILTFLLLFYKLNFILNFLLFDLQ